MATASSGKPIQAGGGDQLAQLAQLLPQLFGTSNTQTSNAGNTQGLQQLMTQLQGANYQGTLESVFQQAAGQIPGFQRAFGNAVGARSGGNSTVEAALSALLQQTALAGQKQVADQQLLNQQVQASAGANMAQATAGTQKTTKTGGSINQIAGLLGLVQAGMKLTGSKDLSEMAGKLGMGGDKPASSGGTTSAQAPVMGQMPQQMMSSAPVTGTAAPQMSLAAPGFDPVSFMNTNAGGGNDSPVMGDFTGNPGLFESGGMSMAPWASEPDFNVMDFFGNEPVNAPQMSFDPGASSFNLMDFFK
jgi:hypothetical protein